MGEEEESIESILTDILSPVQWVLAQYLHACVPITLLVDKYLIYVERSVYEKFHAITYLAALLMEEELSLEDKHYFLSLLEMRADYRIFVEQRNQIVQLLNSNDLIGAFKILKNSTVNFKEMQGSAEISSFKYLVVILSMLKLLLKHIPGHALVDRQFRKCSDPVENFTLDQYSWCFDFNFVKGLILLQDVLHDMLGAIGLYTDAQQFQQFICSIKWTTANCNVLLPALLILTSKVHQARPYIRQVILPIINANPCPEDVAFWNLINLTQALARIGLVHTANNCLLKLVAIELLLY
ncbi:hypothetical protein Ciccas_008255 [Cichlidogyrus casuarinus]|uniref:Uncharacterized protein n=1 Tax=Cichlidogyrus casuarinus TaxID=1844966 RepID=A0ABD2Q0G7_9PLAT